MSEKRKDKKGRLLQQNERQRSDGMYEFRYVDSAGIKRSVYSWKLVPTDRVPSGKRDTKLSLREMEADIQRKTLTGIDSYNAATLTVEGCFAAYMESTRLLQRKTRDGKNRIYRDKIAPFFARQKVSKISRNDVKSLYMKILETGVSMETVIKVDETLNGIFDNALANHVIYYNPCDGVLAELKRDVRYVRGKKHCLTVGEQTAFMDYVKGNKKYRHWYPFFKFMLGTGCRVGEAIGLTWNNCDFDKGVIVIDHAIRYYKIDDTDSYGFEITKPKTEAGIRVIPMLDAVRELLLELRGKHTTDIEIDGVSGFIWRTKFGTLPIPGTINSALYSIQRDYNKAETEAALAEGREPRLLPKFSVHVLRHTFCTRLCENESNTKIIQEVMGHSSIVTTMNVYNEATLEARQQSFEKLNGKIV